MSQKDTPIFKLNENIFFNFSKNDFEELGSIIEFEINVKSSIPSLIFISFFDKDQTIIDHSNLIILTNNDYFVHDNFLFLSSTKNNYFKIKIINQEINFLKVFSQLINDKGNFNQVSSIDVKKNELTKETFNNKRKIPTLNTKQTTNQPQFNVILEEFNVINQSLIKEKENIDKEKTKIKEKYDSIQSMILNFKKEMIIYSEKFYNEAAESITNKINQHTKKILTTENNILNKYKLIKDKIQPSTKINIDIEKKINELKSLKERNLILENKVKNFDEIIGNLKLKLNEKEDIMKGLIDNIEKYKNKIRTLKEENMKIKAKENSELIKEQDIEKPVVNNLEVKKVIENEQVSKKQIKNNKLEISNDVQKAHILEMYFNLSSNLLIPTSFNNFSLLSIFSIQIAKNPLNLLNKCPLSFFYTTKFLGEILTESIMNKSLDNVMLFKSSFVSSILRDFKKYSNDFTFTNEEAIILNPFFNLNEITDKKLNFNLIYYQKMSYFSSYLKKNENKLLEKYNKQTIKLLQFCTGYLWLLFTSKDNLYEKLSFIKSTVFNNEGIDLFYVIKQSKFLELLILIIESIEEFNVFLEIFLFLYLKNHNLSFLNELYERNLNFFKVIIEILTTKNKFNLNIFEKTLIFLNIISKSRFNISFLKEAITNLWNELPNCPENIRSSKVIYQNIDEICLKLKHL